MLNWLQSSLIYSCESSSHLELCTIYLGPCTRKSNELLIDKSYHVVIKIQIWRLY